MWIIRQEQMRLLDPCRRALREFIAVHLRHFFPEQMEGRDEANILALIVRGEEKAAGYGIEDGPGLCKLLDLMVALGEDFDKKPGYAWFTRLLDDPAAGSPAERIDAVARLAATADAV